MIFRHPFHLLVATWILGVEGQISFPGQVQPPRSPAVFPPRPQPPSQPQTPLQPQNPATSELSCTTQNGLPGFCALPVSCSAFYLQSSECALGNGIPGICCPQQSSNPTGSGVVIRELQRVVPIQDFSGNQLEAAGNFGLGMVAGIDQISTRLLDQGKIAEPRTPAGYHQNFFQTDRKAIQLAKDAMVGVETARNLSRQYNLNPEQAAFGLQKFTMLRTSASGRCPVPPQCNPGYRYRSADGSCNNLQVSQWGQSRTAMQRLLPPAYQDGIWSPRVAVSGRELPSARTVSNLLILDGNQPDLRLTLMTMQWGQFLDHDITFAPIFKLDDEGSVGMKCCEDGDVAVPPPHPACFPIRISPQDPFYGRFQQRCMDFVRSLPAPRFGCTIGPAEQMNQVTPWLDGNTVYGSDEEAARRLRAFQGGRMKSFQLDGRSLLPLQTERGDDCTEPHRGIHCFAAGDTRVNEMASLAVIHTIFFRQHNRIAGELQRLNPTWNDERLYQEARRIVGAQIQHITYNEWLPVVLGSRYMGNFGIRVGEARYRYDYDPSINPSVTNAFAAAAFRFGHTLIQGLVQLFGGGVQTERRELRDFFNNPGLLYGQNGLDRFINALVTQSVQGFDNLITKEVTEHLFEDRRHGFGMDLVSLNLQRSRDHGVRGYNEYRELCGLGRARTFNDFATHINPQVIGAMQKVYENVDDVDLFIGGISERPVDGALLGPTFLCIVGDMFLRLQKGDRFFYDLGNQPHSFTPAQLSEIRKTSLAQILCDNSDSLQEIPPLAFHTTIRKVGCGSPAIPRPQFGPWKEGSGVTFG